MRKLTTKDCVKDPCYAQLRVKIGGATHFICVKIAGRVVPKKACLDSDTHGFDKLYKIAQTNDSAVVFVRTWPELPGSSIWVPLSELFQVEHAQFDVSSAITIDEMEQP